MRRFLVIIILTVFPAVLFGQQQPTDTASFYRDMYHYSKDHKLLYVLYRAVFNVPPDPLHPVKDKNKRLKKSIPDSLAGRTIRNISVYAFEPFGTKITDTLTFPHSFVQKVGNGIHIKTQDRIIRNYLLFSEGQTLDLFTISESERLLRQSDFIRNAIIMVDPVEGSSDSVDVKVFAQDKWTLAATVTASTSMTRVRFTEYNFLGLGHRFRNKVEYQYRGDDNSPLLWEGSYLVPNIQNTYISTGVTYQFSPNDDKWGVFVERPFYSALANWAGGISYDGRSLKDSIKFFDQPYSQYKYISTSSNVWAGRSFRLRQGPTPEEKSTRLVLSGGYTRTRYNDLTSESSEVISYFKPVDLYLASLGFSNRRYYTDRYIFDFGELEDVPTGRIAQVTAGYETKGETGRIYTGFTLGASEYVGHHGYLLGQLSFGSFYDQHRFTQGVSKAEVFAFSRLFKLGSWRIRWFGYTSLTYGLHRLGNETISLVKNEGVPGYKYGDPSGVSRFTASMRIMFFNPFEVIGFKFTPLLFGGIGMIGGTNAALFTSKVYPGFGAGFAISNVYLVDADFELLIGFYPTIPGTENTGIRLNPINIWNFSFRDYEFGRPSVLPFD